MTDEELKEKIADKIIRWDTCGSDGFNDMSAKAQNDYLTLVGNILALIREAGYKSPEEVARDKCQQVIIDHAKTLDW